jgi:hypothetical protein
MKLTPMLSVMIGVVAALVIVAVIVMIVLRIQHSQVDEQSKSHLEDAGKTVKSVPIQRELRFRECGSLITEEKHPDASPFGKLDAVSAGDLSESDEKNPDIIPQQITSKSHPRFYIPVSRSFQIPRLRLSSTLLSLRIHIR